MTFTWNWIVFVLYCIGMVFVGYLGYKRTKDVADYYVAGRSFGLKIAVPLFAASFVSSATIVGFTGFAYGYGWSLLAMFGIGVAGGWIALQIFSPRLFNSKYQWYTTPDLYCARYYDEGFMRVFMALFNVFYMLVYCVLGLMGIGTILEVFLGVNYFWGVVLVAAVILIYTASGGMFGVAWTNAVQFLLLFFAVIASAIAGLVLAGGLSSINAQIATVQGGITNLSLGAMHSFTAGGKLPLGKIFGVALGITLICPCSVYYHRIFFSVRSKKVAGSFIGVSAALLAIVYVAVVLIGISARVLAPALAKTEHAFPEMVMMMPVIVGAIIVVGVIAAVQSSIDNQLLSAGTMVTHDIYNKLIKTDASDKQLMKASHWLTGLVGMLALIIALIRPGLVIEVYTFIMILVPTVLFPPLVLGLYWRRTTRAAGIFGCLFGLLGGLGWIFWGPKYLPATLIIVPASIVLMIVISLATPEPPKKVVENFF